LDSGNERGIDILDRMTAKIQEFSDWITSPEGQKALEDWFQQAEDLAVSLGHLAEDLIEFFDELDSEENRKALNDIVELTGELVGAFETMAGVLQIVLGPLLFVIGAFAKLNEQFEKLTGLNLFELFNLPIVAVRELAEAIGKIDFGNILDSLGDLGRSILDGLTRPFRQAFEQLRNIKLPKFDLKNIFKFPPISYIANQFKDAASAVGKAIGKFDLKDIFKIPAISYIANQFKNGAAAVGKAIGKFDIKDIFKIPAISWIADKFRDGAAAVGRAIGKFDLANIFKIPDLDTIASHFSGLGSKIASEIGDVFVDIIPRLGATGGIAGALRNLAAGPHPGGGGGGGSWAIGHITHGPELSIIGEEGPEAVVPLNRPLSQVDPAVRWLSAIAQGMAPPTPMASGGIADRPIDITVITPTEDPRAVATETVNRLVAVGY
jgi:NTP pyrophosphatase (non-canonical NTP hydrolase)